MKAAAPRARDAGPENASGPNPPPAPSEAERSHDEAELDEALADTFPASDPTAMSAPAPDASRALVPVEDEGGEEHGAPADRAADAVDHGREERIRRRAHELWEGEGRPDHRAESHWHQAESEEPV